MFVSNGNKQTITAIGDNGYSNLYYVLHQYGDEGAILFASTNHESVCQPLGHAGRLPLHLACIKSNEDVITLFLTLYSEASKQVDE